MKCFYKMIVINLNQSFLDIYLQRFVNKQRIVTRFIAIQRSGRARDKGRCNSSDQQQPENRSNLSKSGRKGGYCAMLEHSQF